jgi:hypothetical protein
MKLKFLALGLAVALLSQTSAISAKNAIANKPVKISAISKGVSDFYSASDIDEHFTAIPGITTPTFTPLTFDDRVHHRGDAIKAVDGGSAFRLEEGTYEITFTGTFVATSTQEAPVLLANLTTALQIDSVIFQNTQTMPTDLFVTVLTLPPTNFFITVNYTKVIEVDKKKEVSFVVANTTPGTTITAQNRSITITKL